MPFVTLENGINTQTNPQYYNTAVLYFSVFTASICSSTWKAQVHCGQSLPPIVPLNIYLSEWSLLLFLVWIHSSGFIYLVLTIPESYPKPKEKYSNNSLMYWLFAHITVTM